MFWSALSRGSGSGMVHLWRRSTGKGCAHGRRRPVRAVSSDHGVVVFTMLMIFVCVQSLNEAIAMSA